MKKIGGGGDVELPAWSAWLSQDWSAGNHVHHHPGLDGRNDGLAHDGDDPVEQIHNANNYEFSLCGCVAHNNAFNDPFRELN